MAVQQALQTLWKLGPGLGAAKDARELALGLAQLFVGLGAVGASVVIEPTFYVSGGRAAAEGGSGRQSTDEPRELRFETPHHKQLGSVRVSPGKAMKAELLEHARQLSSLAVEGLVMRGEIDERRRQVQQAERLASLGTLAASLAHEIRNPMVSIKTFLQLLPERQNDPEFMGDFLELAEAEVARVTRLLDQLLDFARPAGPRFTETELPGIVHKALALIASELNDKQLEVETRFDEGLPSVRVDPDRMHQVLFNLLLNAAQASPEGERIRVSATGGDGCVRIGVCDAGPGIPDDMKRTLFIPFVTTKKGGSGLGLAVSRQIVEDHGGTLDFETCPGETTFTIELPVPP